MKQADDNYGIGDVSLRRSLTANEGGLLQIGDMF
jgi:hypothetical protein